MKRKLLLTSLLAVGMTSLASPLHAVILTYTDRTAWLADLSVYNLQASATEDFDSFIGQNFQNGSTINLTSIGLSFTHNNPSTSIDDNAILIDTGSANVNGSIHARIDDNIGQNLQILTLTPNISAVGFDYSGYGGSGEGFTSDLGTILAALPLSGGGNNNTTQPDSLFFGFIDTDPGNEYSSFSTTGSDGAYGIDNLVTATVIPEPSSAILLGLGSLGFILRRSRKS